MYENHKLSGEFTLEYLIHLFRCLKRYGSAGDRVLLSQGDIQEVEVIHDVNGSLSIKIFNPISASKLDALTQIHSLNKEENSKELKHRQVLSSTSGLNVAHSLVFGATTLFNSTEEFEIDYQYAEDVFQRAIRKSQFVFAPILNMLFVLLWAAYEFIRYEFFASELSFALSNFDFIEVGFFLINGLVFWASKDDKDDIPVFREKTSSRCELHRSAKKGLINMTIVFLFVSVFTS